MKDGVRCYISSWTKNLWEWLRGRKEAHKIISLYETVLGITCFNLVFPWSKRNKSLSSYSVVRETRFPFVFQPMHYSSCSNFDSPQPFSFLCRFKTEENSSREERSKGENGTEVTGKNFSGMWMSVFVLYIITRRWNFNRVEVLLIRKVRTKQRRFKRGVW